MEGTVMERMTESDAAGKETSKPRSGWARPLARPVTMRDGTSLVTLADLRSFLFKRLQHNRRESPNWQRVTGLLLAAARSDEVDAADVTIALEMAASMEDKAARAEPRAVPPPDSRRP